ncbi:hypothetical protein Hanom_Chr07g00613581 [Helianthus anomalus]
MTHFQPLGSSSISAASIAIDSRAFASRRSLSASYADSSKESWGLFLLLFILNELLVEYWKMESELEDWCFKWLKNGARNVQVVFMLVFLWC